MILYAYHYFLPQRQGEDTKVDERIEFSKTISKKKLLDSSYTIDLLKNKCLKNRYRYDKKNPITDEQAINYFLQEYHEEIIKNIKNG